MREIKGKLDQVNVEGKRCIQQDTKILNKLNYISLNDKQFRLIFLDKF